MKYINKKLVPTLILLMALTSTWWMGAQAAQLPLVNTPLYLTGAVTPKVMLDLSRDHQLFYKAYTDYSDLNGDGTIETTYDHGQDYYGYFDSYKCYNYVSANSRFEPTSYAAKSGTDGASAANLSAKLCSGGWSGNFLNWASMSRIDIVRKLLYGGYRSTDSTTATTLERALIPSDGHAWAKHYNGIDGDTRHPHLNQLTPFATSQFNTAAPTGTSAGSKTLGTGSFTFNSSMTLTGIVVGDQIKAAINATNYMIGYVSAASAGSVTIQVVTGGVTGSGTSSSWTLTNLTQTGITFCNLTNATTGGSQGINTSTNPPVLRVAKGNYALWAVADGKECQWSGNSNGNVASKSEIYANRNSPTSSGQGLLLSSVGPDFTVRVQACASDALIGTERCKSYNNNWKPIGLLQVYGEPETTGASPMIHFGLMTGSYSKNKSGGVLRKNIGAVTDEIDQTTGQFLEPGTTSTLVVIPPSSSGYTSAGNAGIIKTLSRMRIYGYDFSAGNYSSGSDNCSAPNILNPADDQCTNWGNPISEIFTESLRYFAGKTANTAFTGSLSKDTALGLPLATWTDPITSAQYCAPLSTLVFNSSVSSYDADAASISDLAGSPNIATLTNSVGTGQGLSGSYMIGDNGSTNDATCTPKAFSSLSAMKGICPEAPMMSGSYLMAGAAYYARTNKIRSDFNVPSTDTTSLKVKTYGVALATNSPKIRVPIPGSSPTRYITIMPAFRVMSNSTTYNGPGEIVDFKVVRQVSDGTASGTSGKFFVTWDDAPQGNDYDLDVWGYISYNFTDETHVQITTEIVYAAQGYGSAFGFNISGVDSGNGVHFLSANRGSGNNVNIIWPVGCSGGGCEVNATSNHIWGPVSMTFGFSSSSSSNTLEDPLWYAAKWGGFTDLDNNGTINGAEWDEQINSTGAAGHDGNPDSYFFASDPRVLENSLNQAFVTILDDSSSSAVAASSTRLNTNSYIFQASFTPTNWSGLLKAYSVNQTTGAIATNASWNAGAVINGQHYSTGRNIFTYNPSAATKGVTFRWTSLSTTQQGNLNRDPNNANATDTLGSARLDYLRGNGTVEGTGSTEFRRRQRASTTGSTLGDIVNSSPYYVGPPDFGYSENNYAAFKTANASRTPMIYVGGNDGMLHGFDATSGTSTSGMEIMAYVPNKIFSNLHQLTSRTYNSNHRYFVDGTPTVGDAYINGAWKTLLISGLGGGGRGIFALDITNPNNFTESAANAGNLALWEFTDANDSDLGFTFGQVAIVKVCSSYTGGSCSASKWAAIFGNGYNNTDSTAGVASTTGRAALYVLFIEDGASGWNSSSFKKIITNVGSTTTPNGLATPAPVDADGDGIVDFVYAGDLQGNLFRFNLTGAPNSWDYATLFTAKDATGAVQPITSRPEVGRHSTGNGVMVLFGTGRYLATGDNATTGQQTQTFYGIWDQTRKNGSSWVVLDSNSAVQGTRSAADFYLLQQKVLLEATDSSSNPVRITSDQVDDVIYKIDWTRTTPHAHTGWYIDLYNTAGGNTNNFGEKQVTNSVLQGRQVAFNTLIPDTSSCVAGGSGWLMVLDPNDGSRIDFGAFLDSSGNPTTASATIGGVATTVAVSGIKSTVGIPTATTIINATNGKQVGYTSGSKGSVQTTSKQTGPQSSGRVSWREIAN